MRGIVTGGDDAYLGPSESSAEFFVDGISVNSIAPGLTDVEATKYVPEERKRYYVENRPFKRTQMPSDLTGAIVFLMSDASDFITGQCLLVNGGFLMN